MYLYETNMAMWVISKKAAYFYFTKHLMCKFFKNKLLLKEAPHSQTRAKKREGVTLTHPMDALLQYHAKLREVKENEDLRPLYLYISLYNMRFDPRAFRIVFLGVQVIQTRVQLAVEFLPVFLTGSGPDGLFGALKHLNLFHLFKIKLSSIQISPIAFSIPMIV